MRAATSMFNNPARAMDKVEKWTEKVYPCIHLNVHQFMSELEMVNEKFPLTGKRFLDVGCGLGQKVYLAHVSQFQMDAHGLELRRNYVRKGNELLQMYLAPETWADRHFPKEVEKQPNRILYGNAISFKKYADYDVIYFYRPSPCPKVQEKIERAICKGAKKGAIIIGFGFQSLGYEKFHRKYGIKRIDGLSYSCFIKA